MGEIVLTGCTGFIGHKLKVARDRDDLPTYLWDLRRNNWEEFIERDSEIFTECAVVHLAGETDVMGSWKHPGRTIGNNLKCLLEVLEFCRHTTGRLVTASTAFSEDLQTSSHGGIEFPSSPYHVSKAMGEELCRYYSEEYGVNCQNLRIFSVYGAGQPASSLIPTVIQQVTSNSKEVRVQSVDPIRDFVHVDDVTRAIECAIEINPTGFNSYQIGTGQGTSVQALIELIQSIAGTDKPVVAVGGPREKDRNCVVARSGGGEGLGWTTQMPLREGLEKLLLPATTTTGT